MSRPEFPPVPPPPDLTASVVGAALLLAAAEQAPMQMNDLQRNFLTLGQLVERGLLSWEVQAANLANNESTPKASLHLVETSA